MLGGGPGGYTAAFRAADLGLDVVLVDRDEHARRRLPERRLHPVQGAAARREGDRPRPTSSARPAITFGEPKIDLDKVREWKDGVVGTLTGGLEALAKQRKVQVVRGAGEFTGPNTIKVGDTVVGFEHCIIAAGSEAASLPFLPEDDRGSWTPPARSSSTDIPERLLVIGGGIIGLEMATVYDALGSKVTVVELLDQLIPGADKDLDPRAREARQGPLRGDPPQDRRRVASRRARTA